MGTQPTSFEAPFRTAPVRDFIEWRRVARDLLARDIAPHAVSWDDGRQEADLFSRAFSPADDMPATPAARHGNGPRGTDVPDMAPASGCDTVCAPASAGLPAAAPASGPTFHLPRELMASLEAAACFRAPDRWAFLYRVLWRWRAGEREVMSVADVDGNRLTAMVKSVRREEHDMHAYVRFRERVETTAPPRFVAWFEPAHDVLPQVARHFSARMGSSTWMIATPQATVLWDGRALHMAAAIARSAADIDDAGERLWLTYYGSIFNPARLNTTVMHSHIPSRFWKNLPEGKLVPSLVSDAANGGRNDGQTAAVGQRQGRAIQVSAEQAQPDRSAWAEPDPAQAKSRTDGRHGADEQAPAA